MNAQKSLVGVQKKVKVLLYKYSSTSDIYKLLNTPGSDPATTGDKSLVFSPPGTDPTDLEVSSGVVFKELNNGADIVRLPYDSWFSRFFGSANQDTEAADLFSNADTHIPTTVQEFYRNITTLLCSNNSLSWRKMFTENYLANFGKVATELRNKLLTAMHAVIDRITVGVTNVKTLSDIVVQYDISPYLVKRVHITASTEFNNNVKLTLAVDPMAISSEMGNNYLSSAGRYANTSSEQKTKLVDIAENDIIEVRVLYTGIRDGLLKEGKFIDANGYERVFMGYVSGSRRSKMYGQVETVDVDCYGLSKLLETSYVSFDPSMREQTEGSAALFENGAEIDAPEFRGLNNNFSGQSLKEVFDRAIRSLALASETAANTRASAELNPAVPDSPAPSKNLDVINYRMNPGSVLPPTPNDGKTLHFSFQFARHVPFLLYLAKVYADHEPGVDNTRRYAEVIGTAERAQLKAFNLLAANAFRLWYSEMKSFAEVIGMIRQSSNMEIFEDRPAVLRLRPPKYNIINFNEKISDFEGKEPVPAGGSRPYIEVPLISDNAITETEKLIADYAIDPAQIIDISFQRKDPDIQTRTDATMQIPIAGELSQGYTSHFTDLGLLVKYGLRMRSPVSNPFCLSETLCAMVASFSQAVSNAKTRSCSLTLRDDREYRPGRLYYIPTNAAKVKDPSGVVSKGVVGYVESVTTTEAYKEVPVHNLEMNYVRYAEIIKLTKKDSDKGPIYYANFKRLPEIDSILGQATYDKPVAKYIPAAPAAAGKAKKDFGTGVSLSGEDFYIVDNSPNDYTEYPPVSTQYEQGSYLTPINGKQISRPLTKSLLTQLSIRSIDPFGKYNTRGNSALAIAAPTSSYLQDTTSANSFYAYELQCVQNLAIILNEAIYNGAAQLAGEKLDNITPFKQASDINTVSFEGTVSSGHIIKKSPSSSIDVNTYFLPKSGGAGTAPCIVTTVKIQATGKAAIRRTIVVFVPAHKIASLSRIISSGGVSSACLPSTLPDRLVSTLLPSMVHFSDLYLSEWTLADIFAKPSYSSQSASFAPVSAAFEFESGVGAEDPEFLSRLSLTSDITGCTASYQGAYGVTLAMSEANTATALNKLLNAYGISNWPATAVPVARSLLAGSTSLDSNRSILDIVSNLGYGLKFPMVLKTEIYTKAFPVDDTWLGNYDADYLKSKGVSVAIGNKHTDIVTGSYCMKFTTVDDLLHCTGAFRSGTANWDADSKLALIASYPISSYSTYMVHNQCSLVPPKTKSALEETSAHYRFKSGIILDSKSSELVTKNNKPALSGYSTTFRRDVFTPISASWSDYFKACTDRYRVDVQMFSANHSVEQQVEYLGLYRRGTPMQYALYLNSR